MLLLLDCPRDGASSLSRPRYKCTMSFQGLLQLARCLSPWWPPSQLSLYQPKTATIVYTTIAPMMILCSAAWLNSQDSWGAISPFPHTYCYSQLFSIWKIHDMQMSTVLVQDHFYSDYMLIKHYLDVARNLWGCANPQRPEMWSKFRLRM